MNRAERGSIALPSYHGWLDVWTLVVQLLCRPHPFAPTAVGHHVVEVRAIMFGEAHLPLNLFCIDLAKPTS